MTGVHVGLNLLYLLPDVVGGTETYARSLIGALADLDGPERYTAYVNSELGEALADGRRPLGPPDRVAVTACDVRARRRSARYAYEQLRLPRRLRADGVDVLHSLGYVGPLRPPCPHVVTIHDLIYVGFADSMPRAKRLGIELFVRQTARRADHVITVSQASKDDIVAAIGLAPERVTVIHSAARPDLTPASDPAPLRRLGIDSPYVVAFSSASPSKNIPTLIEAFARLVDEGPWQLVLIGHVPGDGSVASAIERHRLDKRVVTTGHVADELVAPLVGGAAAFAFPSRFEGFGLPVLEAQTLGVPVACSDAASLPEVAGDGALYFDPGSVDEIAAALRALLTDPVIGGDLVARGRANAARFTWEQTARQTRDVYEMVAIKR